MPRRIYDIFTDLPISDQRRYQLRKQYHRQCRQCGKPDDTGRGYCEKHYADQLQSNLKWKGQLSEARPGTRAKRRHPLPQISPSIVKRFFSGGFPAPEEII